MWVSLKIYWGICCKIPVHLYEFNGNMSFGLIIILHWIRILGMHQNKDRKEIDIIGGNWSLHFTQVDAAWFDGDLVISVIDKFFQMNEEVEDESKCNKKGNTPTKNCIVCIPLLIEAQQNWLTEQILPTDQVHNRASYTHFTLSKSKIFYFIYYLF